MCILKIGKSIPSLLSNKLIFFVILATYCPDIPHSPNRTVSTDVRDFETFVTLTCDFGYDMIGLSVAMITVFCQEDGTWSMDVFPQCQGQYEHIT